jgi:hypothetical protein
MREVDSDNSANNSHREFDQRDGPANNFVAASNMNLRNVTSLTFPNLGKSKKLK